MRLRDTKPYTCYPGGVSRCNERGPPHARPYAQT